MSFLAYSVDTLTGEDRNLIEVSEFRWARALSAGQTAECTIPLDGIGYTQSQIRDLTAHWGRTIVLEHDGAVVYAGMVRTLRRVAGRSITVGLTDLWGLWARRGSWDHNDPQMETWSVTYTDLDLGTLAKRAVQRGTSGPPVPDMTLPLTLPSDGSGDLDRTYYGYHIEPVGDVLDDLMAEGLDIDFRPRWVSGALDWEMRNDPAENLWEWHVNAPGGGVAGFREDTDGSRVTNNARYVGEGSEEDMVIDSRRNNDSLLPLLDFIDYRKTVSNEGQLGAMSAAALVMYGEPTVSWSFDVLTNGDPGLGELRLGDTARLWFDGDPWIPDGFYDRRIVKLSGDLGERVTVTCQSTGGA